MRSIRLLVLGVGAVMGIVEGSFSIGVGEAMVMAAKWRTSGGEGGVLDQGVDIE